MKNLSKSKIIAYRQCPKRLWLELHKPELRDDSASEAVFAIGHQVGDIARSLFDPHHSGVTIEINELGHAAALERSAELLAAGDAPVFEAGFSANGALTYADVMLPDHSSDGLRWNMIEVKSSSRVKDYHQDDIAVQSYIASQQGVPLASVALAHIDTSFVYPGGGDYRGLLHVEDLTASALARHPQAAAWIADAHVVAGLEDEPGIDSGEQCGTPFPCPFIAYCQRDRIQAEFPLSSLPRFSADHRHALEASGIIDLREVPDHYLNGVQQRVKLATARNEAYFDATAAAAALAPYGFPAYFLDFETIAFAVPVWPGSRPYQQIPFQFSLHRMNEDGTLTDTAFLDLDGDDPSAAFACALIAQCGTSGPVFVYNAAFENRIMRELAGRFPQQAAAINAIIERVVDLLPIARNHYYHPSQHGSWSIKAVLPAVCPDLSYATLDGVKDGGMAQTAYFEAIAQDTSAERKQQLERQLLEYCKLDTYAMVRLWQFFCGRDKKSS